MKHLQSYVQVHFAHPVKSRYVSVIIPVYRDTEGLEKTLQCFSRQTLSQSQFEVIVANDGADPAVSEVCNRYPFVKEVTITPNKGSYKARNTALTESRGEYLAFTDADTSPSPNWLKEGVRFLEQYDYVGGPVKFPKLDQETVVTRYEKQFSFDTKTYYKDLHFSITANMFTKRKVFETIGGFDRRLLSGGDFEFGNRVFTSKLFSQGYAESLIVEHPHRSYEEILKKRKRTVQGTDTLRLFYPKRFVMNYYLLDGLIDALRPPRFTSDLKYFFFVWWMQFVDLYFKARYYRFAKLTGIGDPK